MELVYITHNNIVNLHILPPVLSWPIVVGGAYGAIRLVRDFVVVFIRAAKAQMTPPS